MSSTPLVSVYIPTHNRSALLERALESVLKQTYNNIEILVCSDGSSDNTDDMMAEYCNKYSNIRYFKHEHPKGACAARNTCINNSHGKFCTGLDDDDVFHPQRIQHMVDAITDEDAFVCTSLLQWDLNIKSTAEFCQKSILTTTTSKVTLEQLLLDNIVGNQILATKDKFQAINGFCEDMPAWQDYDTWVRMLLKHGNARKIMEPLYVADIDRTRERITSSSKRMRGCEKFYDRYWHLMNKQQRKNANLRKAIFVNKKLPWLTLFELFNLGDVKNWLRALAIKLGAKL
ncbi:glycosyltransferase family 2 protein [Thalassotalea montiporae]